MFPSHDRGGGDHDRSFHTYSLWDITKPADDPQRFILQRCSFERGFNPVDEYWFYGNTYFTLAQYACNKLHLGNEMRMLTAYYRDCGLLTHMSGIILDLALPNSNHLINYNTGSEANQFRKTAVESFRWFYEDQVRRDIYDSEPNGEYFSVIGQNSSNLATRSQAFLRNYLTTVTMNRNVLDYPAEVDRSSVNYNANKTYDIALGS